MKNYIPNGEMILRYRDGSPGVVQFIPPFNLDCYFQHFSRQGIPIAFGRIEVLPPPPDWTPVSRDMAFSHADALGIDCDRERILDSIELRATSSEGILGVLAVTVIAATDEPLAQSAGR